MAVATRARSVGILFCAAVAALALTSLARPALALPILQEVYYDAPGVDVADAFTEIYGLAGFSLDGWSLVGSRNGLAYRTIDLTGAVIPVDGLLVIATSSAAGAVLAVRDFVADVDWLNGGSGDAIELRDASNAVVDALAYGSGSGSGEGAAAPDAPFGSSLSRDAFGTDTDDNATDFSISAPSPGIGPAPLPVPEPGTSLLLMTGILALAGWRHS